MLLNSGVPPTLPTLAPTPGIIEIEANINTELSSPSEANAALKGIASKTVDRTENNEDEEEEGAANNRRLMEEFDCEETVELMYYNRCNNVISDHKPVRAVLNVKIKK